MSWITRLERPEILAGGLLALAVLIALVLLRRRLAGRPTAPAPSSVLASTQDLPVLAGPAATARSAGPPRLRVGAVSTVGNVREHNEDNYYVPGRPPVRSGAAGSAGGGGSGSGRNCDSTLEMPASLGPDGLYVVADGMGGQLAGEKASEIAVEIIPRALWQWLQGDSAPGDSRAVARAIKAAVAEANREILGLSCAGTEFANMGTTVVLILFLGDRAYIAGIGDSRAYRLRDGRIEQLTEDHSLAKALEKAKTITPEEAETHKFRNVLYNFLGNKDAREGPEEVRELEVRPGDRFLLTSDGLTGVVRDPELARVLMEFDDPQRAAKMLVDRALENQSKDNVTCVVIFAE